MSDSNLPKETPVVGLPSIYPDAESPHHDVILQPTDQQVSELEPEPEPKPVLFELRLTETDVVTGSMPITWCVDKDWLLENSSKDLYVLLSCAPPDKSGEIAEFRTWAKLSDMMAYVTFYRSGKNRITALVVDHESSIDKWMSRISSSSSSSFTGWTYYSIDFPKEWHDESIMCTYMLCPSWYEHTNRIWNYIDVDLPADCFAKEPSALEKRWVNFFFRQKAVDQCEFRKRRILAYSVQPTAFVIAAILYVILLTCIHLFNLMIGKWTVWKNLGTVDTKIEDRIDFLKIKKFNPVEWILVPVPWMTVSFLMISIQKHWPLLECLYPILAYLLVIPLIVWMLIGATHLFLKTIDWLADKQKSSDPQIIITQNKAEEKAKLIDAKLEAKRKAEFEALQLLFCSSGKKIRRIKDLPRNKRTIKLRFQGLKAAVCKPFAK